MQIEQVSSQEPYEVYSKVCSVTDDGVYEFVCKKGHKTKTVLRTPKHEVLFNIGAHAYLDGYYREAITSFAASLERYYEFVLRVIAREKEIVSQLKEMWSSYNFKNSSERQYGAFVSTWLFLLGKNYTDLSKTKITDMAVLRNNVVHKGIIPKAEDCIKYGQYVYDIWAPIETILKEKYPTAHKNECFSKAKESKGQDDSEVTVLTIMSVLQSARKDDNKIETAIEKLTKYREINHFPSIKEGYRLSVLHP